MIRNSTEVGKKNWHEFFFSRRSVFYFSGETDKYFILQNILTDKNILRYYMHMYEKYKDLFYFLKHSILEIY